jgi:putative hydrolase of the HAD superfamily
MFSHVETWIFDLDNTLYHPSARIFDQINARMTGFIMRELGASRAEDIDLSALKPDADLATALRRLPGTRIVHTNGARAHAGRVLAARGLEGAFDAVYAIEDKSLVAKPQPDAYSRIIRLSGLDPARAAMIEDDLRNLEVPKALGMATVWLCHQGGAKAPAFVDRRINGLTQFLEELV